MPQLPQHMLSFLLYVRHAFAPQLMDCLWQEHQHSLGRVQEQALASQFHSCHNHPTEHLNEKQPVWASCSAFLLGLLKVLTLRKC